MLVLSASQQDRFVYQQRVEDFLNGFFDAHGNNVDVNMAWDFFDSEGNEDGEEELFMLDLENEVDDLAEAEALFIDVYDMIRSGLSISEVVNL